MLTYNAKLSLWCFTSTIALTIVVLLLPKFGIENCLFHLSFFCLLYYIILNLFLYIFFKGFEYQVAIRSAFLGYTFSLGLIIYISLTSWHVFGCYMCFMSFFHYSEFFVIAITNPKAVSIDSFILNHSVEYGVAAISSWLEFIIERLIFPGLKEYYLITIVGVVLCTGGEVFRKLAILTAKTNFNHMVQSAKEVDHQLVTHGVYHYCRHPSYVGWFYWSIGTQLILINPFCTIAYAIASWRFFHDRVLIEEVTLLNFFGDEYCQYQKEVPTGLPFIDGFKVQL